MTSSKLTSDFGTENLNFENDAKNFKTVFYVQCDASYRKTYLNGTKRLRISNFTPNDHIWSKFRDI